MVTISTILIVCLFFSPFKTIAKDSRFLSSYFTQNNLIPDTTIHHNNSPMILNDYNQLFPMGAISFADEIVYYDPGALGHHTGDEPDTCFQNCSLALGKPDSQGTLEDSFVSLGKGGTLIVKFSDNVLIDGPGPDLMIFATDPVPEHIKVWISQDGRIFHYVGLVSSINTTLDIQEISEAGGLYPFIKLQDVPDQGELKGSAIGADIDAIGAINTAIYYSIQIDQLFYANESKLKIEASEILKPVTEKIFQLPRAHVTLVAHTDNRGTEDFNLILTQRWVWALRDFILELTECFENQITAIGLGETRPLVPNQSEGNRQINRRIEILIRID